MVRCDFYMAGIKIAEIIVRFDGEGNILSAFGRELKNGKPTHRFFHVDKERVLTNLKFYVDWYKTYLKEGESH